MGVPPESGEPPPSRGAVEQVWRIPQHVVVEIVSGLSSADAVYFEQM
jgi:hypothetical protein